MEAQDGATPTRVKHQRENRKPLSKQLSRNYERYLAALELRTPEIKQRALRVQRSASGRTAALFDTPAAAPARASSAMPMRRVDLGAVSTAPPVGGCMPRELWRSASEPSAARARPERKGRKSWLEECRLADSKASRESWQSPLISKSPSPQAISLLDEPDPSGGIFRLDM